MSGASTRNAASPLRSLLVCRTAGEFAHPPAICVVFGCRGDVTKLCDGTKGAGTCDAPMCEQHAAPFGPNKDHCPRCSGRARPIRRFHLQQVESLSDLARRETGDALRLDPFLRDLALECSLAPRDTPPALTPAQAESLGHYVHLAVRAFYHDALCPRCGPPAICVASRPPEADAAAESLRLDCLDDPNNRSGVWFPYADWLQARGDELGERITLTLNGVSRYGQPVRCLRSLAFTPNAINEFELTARLQPGDWQERARLTWEKAAVELLAVPGAKPRRRKKTPAAPMPRLFADVRHVRASR